MTLRPSQQMSSLVKLSTLSFWEKAFSRLFEMQLKDLAPRTAFAFHLKLRFRYSCSKATTYVDGWILRAVCLMEDLERLSAQTKHEIHVDRLRDKLRLLSEPLQVLNLDLMHIKDEGIYSSSTNTKIASGVQIDGLVMWWSMTLAPGIAIDTRPAWLCDDQHIWREHWLPCVYLFPKPIATTTGEITIATYYDDYSIWFEAKQHTDEHALSISPCDTSPEDARYHGSSNNSSIAGLDTAASMLFSRDRIFLLNDTNRTGRMKLALQQACDKLQQLHVLGFGSFNMAALLAAKLPTTKAVLAVETSNTAALTRACAANLDLRALTVESLESASIFDSSNTTFNVVVSEPFVLDSTEPWHAALRFAKLLGRAEKTLAPEAVIFPSRSIVCCFLVQFTQLHTIRSRVQQACGFDMSAFDTAVNRKGVHATVRHLWEYEHTALSNTVEAMTFSYIQPGRLQNDMTETISLTARNDGHCHGFVLYMRHYWFDQAEDEYVGAEYSPFRQSVHLFEEPMTVISGQEIHIQLRMDLKEETIVGDLLE
eukprot:m.113014 g.113014  ORF g.113014 m.113014 type:complete len:539 (+) comp15345_c0_seq3:423-2039(+)